MKRLDNGGRGRLTMTVFLLLALAGAGAAMAGTPGLKVFFSSEFKDQAYQQKAFQKVAGAWKMPSETPEPGSKAVVVVTIMKDGAIAEATLHMKSGSEAWDSAALAAIKGLDSFDPLPKSWPHASVEAHFHFEWNP